MSDKFKKIVTISLKYMFKLGMLILYTSLIFACEDQSNVEIKLTNQLNVSNKTDQVNLQTVDFVGELITISKDGKVQTKDIYSENLESLTIGDKTINLPQFFTQDENWQSFGSLLKGEICCGQYSATKVGYLTAIDKSNYFYIGKLASKDVISNLVDRTYKGDVVVYKDNVSLKGKIQLISKDIDTLDGIIILDTSNDLVNFSDKQIVIDSNNQKINWNLYGNNTQEIAGVILTQDSSWYAVFVGKQILD